MVTDPKLVDSFAAQVHVLEKMQEGLTQAIKTANGQLEELRAGKSLEDVFGPVPSKQSPAAHGGGGKDHR